MEFFQIESLEIDHLWGKKTIKIIFNRDINIIFGPNASGKTTILNVLGFTLGPNPIKLCEIDFKSIVINLRGFNSKNKKTISVTRKSDSLKYKISNRVFDIDLPHRFISDASVEVSTKRLFVRDRYIGEQVKELAQFMQNLVPIVWLPVSRRLPIPEDFDEEEYIMGRKRRGRFQIESVDERLGELLNELSQYRLKLNTKLSELYRQFENQVLQIILYSKKSDSPDLSLEPLTEDEKELILDAFDEAELLNTEMRSRINEHFKVAGEVINRISSGKYKFTEKDIFILPLIPRTKQMVEYARELERNREQLFQPLKQYESIVSGFLNNKIIQVDKNGEVKSKIFCKFLSSPRISVYRNEFALSSSTPGLGIN